MEARKYKNTFLLVSRYFGTIFLGEGGGVRRRAWPLDRARARRKARRARAAGRGKVDVVCSLKRWGCRRRCSSSAVLPPTSRGSPHPADQARGRARQATLGAARRRRRGPRRSRRPTRWWGGGGVAPPRPPALLRMRGMRRSSRSCLQRRGSRWPTRTLRAEACFGRAVALPRVGLAGARLSVRKHGRLVALQHVVDERADGVDGSGAGMWTCLTGIGSLLPGSLGSNEPKT